MYPVLYKMIDNGYIVDYKKQVGKRMTRVYYHIESSGQDRLEELTQKYLKTTQSIQKNYTKNKTIKLSSCFYNHSKILVISRYRLITR